MDVLCPFMVNAIAGSSSSDDGEQIKIGFNIDGKAIINLFMIPDRAVDLMGLLASAVGEAARNRAADPNGKYVLPLERWEVAQSVDVNMVMFSWKLLGGAEMTFQIDRAAASRMNETLDAILGTGLMTPPIGELRH